VGRGTTILNKGIGIGKENMSDNYASGSTYVQPPTGNHPAILVKVIDIGTQDGSFEGKPTKNRQEIWTFELPTKLMDDGQPFTINKFYTRSLGEKANLTKDLTNWLGKAPNPKTFSAKEVLGKPCQVTIIAKAETGKCRVASVTSLMEGVEVPKKPHNPIVHFSLEPGKFDQEVFDSLTPWTQEQIAKSPEFLAAVSGENGTQEPASDKKQNDDNIPF
jgi:hypothetical protein